MKNKLYILFWFLGIITMMSCEDDSPKATLKENVASNQLLDFTASDYVLTLEDKDNTFEVFKWTEPDFGFASAKTYTVQMAIASEDFANPVDIITVNDTLQASISVGELNKKLLELSLDPEQAVEMDIRVLAKINDKIEPLSSNVQTVSITPYATSFPPIYGMGAALKGWGPWPDAAVELLSSAPKKYEAVTQLTNGEAFRFFAQADWNPTSYNYPFFTTVDAKLENAQDGDSNFKFIGTTGYFKITVDLKNKTVSLLSVPEPVLYMVGAAINGWSWDPGKPVKMTYIKDGVFETTTTFSVEAFRFFAQADWGPTSYNYPFFTTVDSKFENANDGDKNLKFISAPGSYKIRVDLNTKVVTMN
jgi:hypothetical protein